MEIGSAEYRVAARQHLQAAYETHAQELYVTSHYLCGLAVECIWRAYRWRRQEPWDGGHVLNSLYKESRFDDVIPDEQVARAAEHINRVITCWSNNHRYTSGAKLLQYLNAVGVTTRVKGDKLRHSSSRMYEAAEFVVLLGLEKWK